jgi:hypothetical protein
MFNMDGLNKVEQSETITYSIRVHWHFISHSEEKRTSTFTLFCRIDILWRREIAGAGLKFLPEARAAF